MKATRYGGFFYIRHMKQLILSIALTGPLFYSCAPEDPAFCDCLDATEKLNEHSEKILNGDYTEADLEKQVELRKEKEKLCKAYDTISGEKSMRLKEDCENR